MKLQKYFLIGFVSGLLSFHVSCDNLGVQTRNADFCDGYQQQESSEYILPYNAGKTFEVTQGNCGAWTHYGVVAFAYDFDTTIGDPILAVRAGVVDVVNMGNSDDTLLDSQVNEITIVHDDGTLGSYVHLKQDSQLVSSGERVEQGQQIAESGASGTKEPHLHFQVYTDKNKTQTRPISFRNASPVAQNGLVQGERYTALDFE